MTTQHVSTKIDAKFGIIAFLIGAEKYISYHTVRSYFIFIIIESHFQFSNVILE